MLRKPAINAGIPEKPARFLCKGCILKKIILNAVIIGIAIFAGYQCAGAQELEKKAMASQLVPTDVPANPFSSLRNITSVSGNENAVDPERYFVGGGDEFFISAVGMPLINYRATVNSRRDLYIPEVGLVKLGRIRLSEAQIKIGEFIKEKMKKQNDIYVFLTKCKSASVTVNGEITNPGTYVLQGTFRVLDAIRAANNNLLPPMSEFNYREVLCSNSGEVTKIDLFEYLLGNDVSGNPYLYPGDNITVRSAARRVFLACQGQPKTGMFGWIPIKENETLAGFLALQKFDASVDTSVVFFCEHGEQEAQATRAVSRNEAMNIVLHDKDIVTVPLKKNYSRTFLVFIGGEVARPGQYPMLKDSTTAEEVVAMAGGATEFANEDRTVIIRSHTVQRGKWLASEAVTENFQDMKTVRPEMVAGLKKMLVTLDFGVINCKSRGMKIKLQENDRIIVPKKDRFIYVSGSVRRPGAYEYSAGQGWRYYIHMAGGFTAKADRRNMFGIRSYENASQMTDLSDIAEGDIIIVPDSQEMKYFVSIVVPVVSIILTAIGTALTIYSISRR